jgi:aspartate carbamoyltransferase catalytic subunit
MSAWNQDKSRKHCVSLADFTVSEINALMQEALMYKKLQAAPKLSERVAANLFFEASTRTKLSFEMAQQKSGMHLLNLDIQQSSVTKGESLLDTVRTLEAIGAEAVVIRHAETGFFEALKDEVGVSLINAGDGSGEHPSQSLLDAMTMLEQFGHIEGLNVVVAGDVLHSRVARSNAQTLARLGARVRFAAPPCWQDPSLGEFVALDAVIDSVDALMLLRVQHERHDDDAAKLALMDDYLTHYGLTEARAAKLKPSAMIMHPGPVNWGVEMAPSLIKHPQSSLMTQMTNGVYARMAILNAVLNPRSMA